MEPWNFRSRHFGALWLCQDCLLVLLHAERKGGKPKAWGLRGWIYPHEWSAELGRACPPRSGRQNITTFRGSNSEVLQESEGAWTGLSTVRRHTEPVDHTRAWPLLSQMEIYHVTMENPLDFFSDLEKEHLCSRPL